MDPRAEGSQHQHQRRKPVTHVLEDQKKIYTDWANHYLVKSGRKRLIKDLQQDVSDGVLLAEIIQVVANERIEDINGYPKSRTQMVENIDTCLGFLAAKGVNIQGLCAEEIRNGNLKAILGLFFSLSRYKQHQQKVLKQQVSHPEHSPQPGHRPHGSPAPGHNPHGSPIPGHSPQGSPVPGHSPHGSLVPGHRRHGSPAPGHSPQGSPAPEHSPLGSLVPGHSPHRSMATGHSPHGSLAPGHSPHGSLDTGHSPHGSLAPGHCPHGSLAPGHCPHGSSASLPTPSSMAPAHKAASDVQSRLPGPPMRAPASGCEGKKTWVSSSNRRSQSFNHYDKPRPSNDDQERSTEASLVMTEHAVSPGPNGYALSSVCQPNAGNSNKPWRSKSLRAKHSATSPMLSVKQEPPTRQSSAMHPEVPPKVIAQKSMLEKLKLFNSKGGSKAVGVLTDIPTGQEKEVMEVHSPTLDRLEEIEENCRPPGSKLALKGIAQRTFSRALSPRKSSLKTREKGKDKTHEGVPKTWSVTGQEDSRDGSSHDGFGSDAAEPKRNTKSTSLIPKGGKAGGRESSSSGIPKPGKTSSGREGERPRSLRASGGGGLSVHKGLLDHRSSCSSMASSEGRPHHLHASVAPPSAPTACSATSVQLPQPQQHHPNTATVAPFMYRSQPDVTMEPAGSLESGREETAFRKSALSSLEDLTGEEPEARRLRTVRNIADLRQNLEETMSSLRGTQISHSALETTFDSSVTTEVTGKGLLNLCTRPNPALPWRPGPSGPRLQAGDAPSNGYAVASRTGGVASPESGLFHRSGQTSGQGSTAACELDLTDKMKELDGVGVLMGYVSDGDVLENDLRLEKASEGHMTDDGLSAFTQRLRRLPGGVQETLHRKTSKGLGEATDSWDDSSSVSSGISDTDDINTSSSVSSYVNTPSVSCKDLEGRLQTDAGKQNSAWSGGEGPKRSDWGPDGGPLKMELGSKWCHHPLDMAEESDRSSTGCKMPSVSHTGSWRRGMSAQVGVTSPRTKGPVPLGCGSPKTHGTGKTDDAKVSEKGQHNVCSRASRGLLLAPSDPSRCSGDESRKPPPSSGRTPTTNTFGFKKHGAGTITSGSATLGRIPKSAQIHGGRGLGRQASVDDAYLPVSSHSALQYRSLPRPSRASGRGRSANHSSSASIDSNLSSRSIKLPGPKSYSQVPKPGRLGSPLSGSNQTDREKGGSSGPTAPGSATLPQGARPPGGKYPDVSSPTLRRLFGGKQVKQPAPVAAAENMKHSTVLSNPHTNSGQQGGVLDSPSASSGGSSPLYGGAGRLGVEAHSLSPLASSPGSALSTPSHSLAWSTSLSRDPQSPGKPSLSSLTNSDESMDVSLGSGGHGTLPACVRNNGVKAGFSDSPLSSPSASPKFSRNTLPRKQDRYGHLPQLRCHDDPRDWLRSHSAGGLQESAGSSFSSTASGLTSPSGPRFNSSQLGSPTTAAQINLANLRMGLASQEGPHDPSGDPRLRNSSMSLEEKSRTISSSGSFKDGLEEVHGSSLSLVSSSSSVYSTPEEKSHSEIRKLRRELDSSQDKVSALTTQLTANAHLVAAFEQSLGNMTSRLQGLTITTEQKDSELNELRNTIEHLKKHNTAAQAAINDVINLPQLPSKRDRSASANESPPSQQDLRIHRQHSSDSVSSITSATSHSSAGSNLEMDAKNRRKRKNWLRSSFKQAFGKKKSPKSTSSDIEETADCSQPNSPQFTKFNGSSTPMLRTSHSNSLISEGTDSEAEAVMVLRSELRDKEMKLTDIRLEALSSAHQLDQLRESLNRMQAEMERLKAENDRLKMENQGSCSKAVSQAFVTCPSAGQTQPSVALTESTSLDMLLEDSVDGSSWKDGRRVKVVVTLDQHTGRKEESRSRQFLIGCIGVSGKTRWDVLDGVVRRLFKEYISHVDPVAQLGLSSDSVLGYSIGDIQRAAGATTPELLPCGYLVGDSDTISVSLKGDREHSQDSLVLETLIPKPLLQSYVSQLHEHRRLILSGPSGTGKSFLASRLAEHAVLREGGEGAAGTVATFNIDHKSSKELRQYLSNLASQCNSATPGQVLPLVVILENLQHVSSLGEVFNALLSCKQHSCPYIIGTMNQATSSTTSLQVHHNFRWVLCANHTEPVKGFLGRFLRRKLMETEISSRHRNAELVRIIDWIPAVWHYLNYFLESHSSSDVTIGPRLFLSCPMDVEGSRVWFTDLWNYSIIPYVLEAVREGLQLYGRRAPWEDPTRWVMESYPWAACPLQQEWPQLLQLRPVDVGLDGYSPSKDGCPSKQVPQGDTDSDPLMHMLMRLKEAAHSSGRAPSYHSDSNSNHDHHDDTILASSLEST